jgi:hypothetical protein
LARGLNGATDPALRQSLEPTSNGTRQHFDVCSVLQLMLLVAFQHSYKLSAYGL